MRVLHIIPTLATGGAEKLILETVPLLNKRGIQTDVLVLKGGDEPFYKQLKELDCCNLYSLGNGSVYNPSHIFKILPYLKKYDLIHSHLFSAQYFVALAKMISFLKIPIIFTEHNTSNRRMQSWIFKIPERIVYSLYHKVVCITEEVCTVLKNHTNIKSDKLIIIENGINFKKFNQAIPYEKCAIDKNINQSDFLLIQVAGFRIQKDQFTLIKSLVHLPSYVKLVLVGDGENRSNCEQLTSQLHLLDRVFFLGIRTDIPELLKTVDVIVLSTKYEGLSLSSIEGLASGKPFIGSDVPGLTDIVNGTGIQFPLGDDKKLAEEILKLMSDKDYYRQTALRCVEKAKSYDIDLMVDKTIDLYKQVLLGVS